MVSTRAVLFWESTRANRAVRGSMVGGVNVWVESAISPALSRKGHANPCVGSCVEPFVNNLTLLHYSSAAPASHQVQHCFHILLMADRLAALLAGDCRPPEKHLYIFINYIFAARNVEKLIMLAAI